MDAGISTSKLYIAPRLGLAYRPTNSLVIRAGYGISYDTWSIIRNMLSGYPVTTAYTVPVANTFTPAGRLSDGIPATTPPDLGNGIIDMPLNVNLTVPANPYVRPNIQSWNLTLQSQLGRAR